jgi:hypothetical protein
LVILQPYDEFHGKYGKNHCKEIQICFVAPLSTIRSCEVWLAYTDKTIAVPVVDPEEGSTMWLAEETSTAVIFVFYRLDFWSKLKRAESEIQPYQKNN